MSKRKRNEITEDCLDILQVKHIEKSALLQLIYEKLKEAATTNKSGEPCLTFLTHFRSKEWQIYSEKHGRIVLLNSMKADHAHPETGSFYKEPAEENPEELVQLNLKRISTDSLSRKRQACLCYDSLVIIKDLLEKDEKITLTSFYYRIRSIRNDCGNTSREQLRETLHDLACYLGCRRVNIPVEPEEKGKIGGLLTYKLGDKTYDCRSPGGILIPKGYEEIKNVESEARCIVVVEKHSVFSQLMRNRFFEDVPCILLSGSGQPDITTRWFLRELSTKLKIPVYVVVDAGSFGFSIYMTYLVGSGNIAYDNANLCTPNCEWLGVLPSEIASHRIPSNRIKMFTKHDGAVFNNPLWGKRVQSDQKLRDEINIFKEKGEKIDIEDFNSLGTSYFELVYLKGKLHKYLAECLDKEKSKPPKIMKAGASVLYEKAEEVSADNIESERIQNIIDAMVSSMREASAAGLAAPQIGISLRIIVLEDKKEVTKAQDRIPLIIINPKVEHTSKDKAWDFERCSSVDGHAGYVERYREVEVVGFDRRGKKINRKESGEIARFLQHKCDHLDGVMYVDKMHRDTFRTVENIDEPLPDGCPPRTSFSQVT